MCGRPRCWQWSIKFPSTPYTLRCFVIWQKHIFENQTDWNSGFLDLILLFFTLFYIFDNDYTHEGWIKENICYSQLNRLFTRFPSSWTQIRQSGAYCYTPYGFIQISKDGKRKCNYITKRRNSVSICMRLWTGKCSQAVQF